MFFYLVVVVQDLKRAETGLTDIFRFLRIKLGTFLAFKRFYKIHCVSKGQSRVKTTLTAFDVKEIQNPCREFQVHFHATPRRL